MTSQVEHTDVGAYALGLLDGEDRRAFEEHLAQCHSCLIELSDLSGIASALSGLGPVEIEDDPPPADNRADVLDRMRHRKAAERRTRRGTFVIGLAAAVTLVAGGIAVGTQLGGGPVPEVAAQHDEHATHLGPAEQFYADGTPIEGVGSDGVTGGLVIESKAWGTHAALKLAGLKGPQECELVSVAKTGDRRIMTGWSVPPAGYGVPGSPDPLYMHGGSPWPLERIDHFEVVTTTGKTLLTVKA
jgi:hypothetical protein